MRSLWRRWVRAWRLRRGIRLVACALGFHSPVTSKVWHDEGSPLEECSRCGAVDVARLRPFAVAGYSGDWIYRVGDNLLRTRGRWAHRA